MQVHTTGLNDLPPNKYPHNYQQNNGNNNQDDYYYYFNGKTTLNNFSTNQPAIDEILTLYQEQSPTRSKKGRRRNLDLPLPPLPSEAKSSPKKHGNISSANSSLVYFGSSVERRPSSSSILLNTGRRHSRHSNTKPVVIANTYQSPSNRRRNSGRRSIKHNNYRRSIRPLNLQLFPLKSGCAVRPIVRHLPERRTAKIVRANSHRSLVMPQVGTLDASRYRFLTDDSSSTSSSKSTPKIRKSSFTTDTPRVGVKLSHRKASLFNNSTMDKDVLQKELPPLPDVGHGKVQDNFINVNSIAPLKLNDKNKTPESPTRIITTTSSTKPIDIVGEKSTNSSPKTPRKENRREKIHVDLDKPSPPLPKDEQSPRSTKSKKIGLSIKSSISPKSPKPSKSPKSPKSSLSPKSPKSPKSLEQTNFDPPPLNLPTPVNEFIRPISISSDTPNNVILNNSNYVFTDNNSDRDSSSIFKSQGPTVTPPSPSSPVESTTIETNVLSSLNVEATPPLHVQKSVDHSTSSQTKQIGSTPSINEQHHQHHHQIIEHDNVSITVSITNTTIDDEEQFVTADSYTPQSTDAQPLHNDIPKTPEKNEFIQSNSIAPNRLASPIPLSPSSIISGVVIHKSNETPRTSISSDSLSNESTGQGKDYRHDSVISASSSVASGILMNELIDNKKKNGSLSPLIITPRSDLLPGSDYVNRLRTSASIHEQITPTEEFMPSSDANQPKLRKKFNLIRELVDTEEIFATDMGVLVDIYYRKLRSEQFFGYICKTDMMRLFSNVDQVLLLSRQFVMTLKDSINPYVFDSKSQTQDKPLSDVATKLGQAILDFIPSIESTFQTYCDSNKWQMDTFYRLRSLACPNIDLWLSECLEASKGITTAWTLDALLIKPVQRLLKYPLLLDSMLKVTNPDHADYENLKLASELMRDCVDRINKDHPPDFGPALPGNSSQRSSDTRRRSAEEDAISLRQLKTNPNADPELQDLLVDFNLKRKNIRKLIQAIATNSADVQHQFNSNSSLAKAWLTWSMAIGIDEEDSVKMRKYKHYALFSTPFTSTSSTQLSTARLSRKIEREVLLPLENVWVMYERTEVLATDRLKFHTFYAKYVASKSGLSYATTMASGSGDNSFSSAYRQKADLFFKYHNSLKDGLPDLFRLTDRMVECCFSKYIEIQRQWFRMAVDSMATVFNLRVDDIQDSEGRLDHDPVVEKFRKAEDCKGSVLDLGICRESFIATDDSAISSTSDSESVSEIGDKLSLTPMLSTITTSSTKDKVNIRRKSSLLSLTNWQLRNLKNHPSKFMSDV